MRSKLQGIVRGTCILTRTRLQFLLPTLQIGYRVSTPVMVLLLDLGGSYLEGSCMALRPSMVLMSLIWNRGMDGGFEDLWGMDM
jgi:hypothetical protein